MPVIYLTTMAEFDAVAKGPRPAIIEFWAEWCTLCDQMSEMFDRLALQNPTGHFYRVDTEEARDIAIALGVRSLPAYKVYVKGVPIGEFVGANPTQLERLVTKTLSM